MNGTYYSLFYLVRHCYHVITFVLENWVTIARIYVICININKSSILLLFNLDLWRKMYWRGIGSKWKIHLIICLNILQLSTILLVLFRAKFACILTISNPVFRWESCKGSEWESVKKCLRLCKDAETRSWTRGWLQLASHQSWHTHEACRGAKESCQLLHYRTKVLG